MPSDKSGDGGRSEFEVAYDTKELGRALQKKLLRQRLADFSDSRAPDAGHAEDGTLDRSHALPREDRAG
ncbi:hypothetical protein [Ramlibacter sp.]|uniref:hypothetical protein n=1 Tax=Ramlibacter sp. TaxID=1917967 RepID=UPI0018373CAD|nr:hypothetical protein [Ramlibacter sp.]MBA2674776.1 hypothetical protein [Ramlibacter sp.]